ncbi:PAS domain S-box protein [bacterium]|nr:PAS domain S-box protein [bacterium]MBU4562844.1 PAS domain S-box protein [bacterium]
MKDTKKTEEQLIAELAESEEKYRIQVEMATDAVFLETVEGRVLECNTAGAKMYGYTKEEIVGLTIADLVPEEFAKTLPKIITEKETTQGKFVSRISKKKDGTIFPTEIATKLINIEKNPRLIVYIRDITERKRAEKKRKSLLKKEREQHLKAETSAKVALILTSKLSLSAVLEEVLRQVKRLVPYSACNIFLIKKGGLYNVHSVGYDKYGSKKFVNNFTYPVDKISLDKEVIKSAKPRLISDTHQNPRWIIFKETSWVKSCLIVPICLNNKVIGFLNLDGDTPGKFVKDDIEKLQPLVNAAAIALENARLFEEVQKEISERKQVEKNVKNAKDELQMIMDSVPAIIFYKDTEGIIIRANKTLADSLKMPIKDIIGKTTEELFPKEQAKNMRKDDQLVIVSGKPKRNIIESYTTPDGVRWLTTDKIPYKDKEGKITGVIGLAKDITVQRKSEQELQQSYQRLKKTMDATIDTMSKIVEAKDPYTSGHQYRVCQLAIRIAQELNLPKDKVEGIRIASLIHDIGKIGLPAEILSKPTKLADIEFSLIKEHSQVGYDILKSIDFSHPVAKIILQHHERLNGSGYPNKLKGDEILLEAKIIGVADVVEAMSSHRPYRPARGLNKALEEISQNRGILYDPEVVDICLKLFKEKGFKFE